MMFTVNKFNITMTLLLTVDVSIMIMINSNYRRNIYKLLLKVLL